MWRETRHRRKGRVCGNHRAFEPLTRGRAQPLDTEDRSSLHLCPCPLPPTTGKPPLNTAHQRALQLEGIGADTLGQQEVTWPSTPQSGGGGPTGWPGRARSLTWCTCPCSWALSCRSLATCPSSCRSRPLRSACTSSSCSRAPACSRSSVFCCSRSWSRSCSSCQQGCGRGVCPDPCAAYPRPPGLPTSSLALISLRPGPVGSPHPSVGLVPQTFSVQKWKRWG